MKTQLLTDIDSLILKVRNPNSKEYINEALISFRAGSNRSAILLTWIALSYDIISKIREIAIDDKGAPQKFIDEFDNASANHNTQKLLVIEREILASAKDLELINNHEYHALERLREDRHKCAHPSHESEDYLFIPSPEQVRTHLTHALNFVLIHKPTQGKKALERLIDDIVNASYLEEYDDIRQFFQSKFLKRAKSSFKSNALKILVKSVVCNSVSELVGYEIRTQLTLKAFYNYDFYSSQDTVKSIINKVLDTNNVTTFINLTKIISIDNKLWDFISDENRTAFLAILQTDGNEIAQSPCIHDCIAIGSIKTTLDGYLSNIDDIEFLRVLGEKPIKYFKDTIVEKFVTLPNYSKTKDYGYKLGGSYSKFLTVNDLKKILGASAQEDQIYGYYYFDRIMLNIFSETKDRLLKYTKDDWINLVQIHSSLGEVKTALIQEGVMDNEAD